jgi:hypothetical protein
MNKELRYAQTKLTESVIRKFWKAMTLSFPSMCVNDGVSIEYHQPFTSRHVEHIVDQLTKCKSAHVACPLFQYEYDPPNSTPHHVSAITVTKSPKLITLSFFDPKGRGSERPREEELLMKIIQKRIEEKTGKKTLLKIYNGENLQRRDDIGLCQLYSLFYLYEYVNEVSKLTPQALDVLSDPNAMVDYVKKKRGSYDEKTLLSFWNAYFQTLQRK